MLIGYGGAGDASHAGVSESWCASMLTDIGVDLEQLETD
jgi:hypothetical protein